MTPADKRVLELLDRWLTSIELHLKYVDLDEPGYQQVQPWPVHERPAKWMLELAQQKVLQLKALCKTQFANQDPVLAESLELMAFLANLVGAQNIHRFIPLADPANEQKAPPPPVTAHPANTGSTNPIDPPQPTSAPQMDVTREMPQIKTKAASAAKSEVEHTREMPRLKLPVKKPAAVPHRSPANSQHKPASGKPIARKPSEIPAADIQLIEELVVSDALRLLKWGKQWHELAELIARMAERPALAEVRRILRSNKQRIEAEQGS